MVNSVLVKLRQEVKDMADRRCLEIIDESFGLSTNLLVIPLPRDCFAAINNYPLAHSRGRVRATGKSLFYFLDRSSSHVDSMRVLDVSEMVVLCQFFC